MMTRPTLDPDTNGYRRAVRRGQADALVAGVTLADNPFALRLYRDAWRTAFEAARTRAVENPE